MAKKLKKRKPWRPAEARSLAQKYRTARDPMTAAKKIMVDLALEMTKMDERMRVACRLVHVNGLGLSAAGEAVGRPRQHVYRALRALEPHYEVVKAEVAKHGATP